MAKPRRFYLTRKRRVRASEIVLKDFVLLDQELSAAQPPHTISKVSGPRLEAPFCLVMAKEQFKRHHNLRTNWPNFGTRKRHRRLIDAIKGD
jgi:hypothetical protein